MFAPSYFPSRFFAPRYFPPGTIVEVILTKGGSPDEVIRIRHQQMLRKQLHLKKQPVKFDILVNEDGETQFEGLIVPTDLAKQLPNLRIFTPSKVIQDELTEEIALLIRTREIELFNQSVTEFKLEMEMRQLEEDLLILLIADELD